MIAVHDAKKANRSKMIKSIFVTVLCFERFLYYYLINSFRQVFHTLSYTVIESPAPYAMVLIKISTPRDLNAQPNQTYVGVSGFFMDHYIFVDKILHYDH